jgi:pimeloyl-ACP methyl ester carboxylesterase
MIYSDKGFTNVSYKFKNLNLEQLTIIKKNNKKCIIFLHGIGGSKISLTGLASAYQKKDFNYDLLLPDLPGAGSAIELNFDDQIFTSWLQQYLKLIYEKYNKVIIIGHSLGAYQCIMNADLLNKYCQKIILLCPVLSLDIIAKTTHSIFNLLSKINEDLTTNLVSSRSIIKLSNNIMVQSDNKTKNKILESRLRELDIVNKPSWFNQCLNIQKVISKPDFQNKLSKIKIETLVIGARKDVVAEVNNYPLITYKNGWDLIFSEDCGHQLPNEDPKWLAEQIRIFLKNKK